MSHPPTFTPTCRRPAVRAAAALLLALICGCDHKPAMPPAMERPPAPVTTAAALHRDVPVYLDEIGRCVATEVVSIQPQVSGRIIKVHFANGADVKQGDLLFSIDPRLLQAELAQAQARLGEFRAVLELAKSEFSRIDDMMKVKAASQQEYDIKKNAVAVAEAQIQSSLAGIDRVNLSLEYCQVHAPISGRAGTRLVDEGNVVTANNGDSLLVIQRIKPIYAEFTVTEANLARVREHMAKGTLAVEVKLPDDAAPQIGQLTFLDNAVKDSTGTVKLRATLANEDQHFWPGQFVRVRLVLATLKDAVLLPASATRIGQVGPFVYVVKDDSTAELRPIKPGQRQGDLLVVEEGVKAGEKIVLTGHMMVSPGGKVMVTNAAPPATAPAEDVKVSEGSAKK